MGGELGKGECMSHKAVTRLSQRVVVRRLGVAPPRATDTRRAVSPEATPQDGSSGRCTASEQGARAPCALVVDDDPEGCRVLAQCLSPELEVHLARSVREACVSLSALQRLDVAFVVLELPDGTGEQILEQLVRWPDAIRVLISGSFTPDKNPLNNRALANLILAKPVGAQVVQAVKQAALALPNT
jgi:CheY-like chemotaxis protein